MAMKISIGYLNFLERFDQLMGKGRYYNLMIVPDGVEAPIGFRMKSWLFKALVVFACLLILGMVLFFAFYGKILMRAQLADQLERENEELRKYKLKIDILESRMDEATEIVRRISELAGVEFELAEIPPDSVIFAGMGNQRPAQIIRSANASPDCPDGLPLQGYMTRGYNEDHDTFHPGVDIAVEIGTPVLATASGKVSYAEFDSTYGNMVILDHENNVQTAYGHNSELLVEVGKEVLVGGRIALSGNSGTSSAPHLHYEIRENGKPVNPLKYITVYEESN